MPNTLRHHSAWAQVLPVEGSKAGVLEIRVTGVLTPEAFAALRPQVFRATRDAPAVIVRLDTALDVLLDPPSIDTSVYRPEAPPQAVVVSKGQYMMWLQMADNLRKIGVRRAIFTPSRLEAAIRWAELVGQGREIKSRDPETSGPTPLDELP